MVKVLLAILFLLLFLAQAGSALNLKESVEIALRKNPGVISIQKKADASGARLSQAIGAFFPTVKLDGSYGKIYSQPAQMQITSQTSIGAVTTTQSFGTDAASNSNGWKLSLSQPIFAAALFPGFKIAQRSYDLSKEDYRKAVQSTTYDVAVAYFGLLSSDKFLQLAEEAMRLAKSHLAQVGAMLESGVATRADLLRAEVRVANSEVALTRSRNADELARNLFNNVLGRKLDEKVEITDETIEKSVTLPNHQYLLDTAFENRPDWKQYVYGKQIAEENLSMARAAYLPAVFFNGQIGNQFTEYPAYKYTVNSWSVMGAASWTLFDGLGIQNRVKEAAANLEAQSASEEQVRNAIALEVRSAYLELKSVLETITSAKKAVDFAEESLKVSDLRFNSGVGTNLEVIDAQVALTQAKTDYLKAGFDLGVAKAKINKVVGGEVI